MLGPAASGRPVTFTLGFVVLTNKKKLNSINRKESSLPLIYKISFLIGFVLLFFVANYFFEQMAAKYKNSLKVSVSGTFKTSVSARFRTLCFFEVEGDGTIPLQCTSDFYQVGQKVRLTKIIKVSGEYFYSIDELHP